MTVICSSEFGCFFLSLGYWMKDICLSNQCACSTFILAVGFPRASENIFGLVTFFSDNFNAAQIPLMEGRECACVVSRSLPNSFILVFRCVINIDDTPGLGIKDSLL